MDGGNSFGRAPNLNCFLSISSMLVNHFKHTNSATRVCPSIADCLKKYRAVCHQLFLQHVYNPVPNKQGENSACHLFQDGSSLWCIQLIVMVHQNYHHLTCSQPTFTETIIGNNSNNTSGYVSTVKSSNTPTQFESQRNL